MRIQVTQQCIDRAISDYIIADNQGFLRKHVFVTTRCCPIFHAIRAAGVPVVSVGLTKAWLAGGECAELSPEAIEATNLPSSDWNKIQPFEFELTIDHGFSQ